MTGIVIEKDAETFTAIKRRLHIPWYAQSFRLDGQQGEKLVVIRKRK